MSTQVKKVLAITFLAATIVPFGATEAVAAAPPRVRISADVEEGEYAGADHRRRHAGGPLLEVLER